jgi:hypothetical protein
MPLTGALVLVWVYLENKGDQGVMQNYAVGALFGIVPSIIFFLVALIGFKIRKDCLCMLCYPDIDPRER